MDGGPTHHWWTVVDKSSTEKLGKKVRVCYSLKSRTRLDFQGESNNFVLVSVLQSSRVLTILIL